MAFRNLIRKTRLLASSSIRKIRAKFKTRSKTTQHQTPYYTPPANQVQPSSSSSCEYYIQTSVQLDHPPPRHHQLGLVQCPNLSKTPIETRNDRESYLHRLPREILDMVVKNLSPAAQHSLRISCRKLCYTDLQISDLSDQKDGLEFCELFERDEIALGRLHCTVCKDTDMSNLLPMDRKKEPGRRACLMHKPVLNVCECRSLSFCDVRNMMYDLQQRQSYGAVKGCPTSCTWPNYALFTLEDGHMYLNQYLIVKPSSLLLQVPLRRAGVCCRDCVQICPHLTFRSPEVKTRCDPRTKSGRLGSCSYCDTVFEFQINSWDVEDYYMDFRSSWFLKISRNLGTLQSVMDPKWLSQTSINEMWKPHPEPWSANGGFSHIVYYLSDIGVPRYWVSFRKTNLPYLYMLLHTEREELDKMGGAYMFTPDKGVHSIPVWIGPENVAKDEWGEYGPDGFTTQDAVFGAHNGNDISRLVKR
ncbi:hypothetical protein FQN55_001378 [Onygenales sp. PD_40]|nr:hypothetical protein FQN55_001378 [Onygenales sp. PD_40]KAK2777029.1 hypothetical protein FQN52_003256 [Onygenales sp. PD_12]